MIEQMLSRLGFSEKETETYLALLTAGKTTPKDLAKKTKINRTTVYNIAKILIERGVIAEDLGGKTMYLVALPPENLTNLVKQDDEKLITKRKLIEATISQLSWIHANTQYSIPKIRFIEEENLNNYLYKQADTWNKSAQLVDKIWWGFQDHTLVESYKDWIEWLWKNIHKKGEVKLLSNISDIEKNISIEGREIKFWEKAQNFTATLWIVGDYIIMINTRQRPHYLVEIYDAVIAHNMREIYKGVWNSLAHTQIQR